MTDDRRFLERWSRRKTAARTEKKKERAPSDPVAAGSGTPAPLDPSAAPQEIDPDTLPDVDSMDENSDFSIFMRDGVPEALRNRALRKLWQADPAFNVVDGLLEYGEDYTDSAAVAEAIKTVYRVGKGMAGDTGEEEKAAEDRTGGDEPSGDDDQTAPERRAALDEPTERDVALDSGKSASPKSDGRAAAETVKKDGNG